MKKLTSLITRGLLIIGAIATVVGVTTPTYALIDPQQQICQGTGGNGGANCTGQSKQSDLGKIVANIVNVLLYITGAVAVIMIIIGGLRYVTSNGDSSKVKGAKDTILYAVIGLIVAILAFAIVNFVLKSFA